MKNQQKHLISPKESIKKAILKMKKSGARTVVVTNPNKYLLGTLSSGDIQKSLLKNSDINSNVESIYNKNPKKIFIKNLNIQELKKLFLDGQYGLIPVVNNSNIVQRIITWDEVFNNEKKLDKLKKIDIVIMAGGKGERLQPYTKVLPKPLVPIDNKPMLEHIIENFNYFNFKKFHLILNHHANLIKSYFESSKNKNYQVNFVKEPKPLGTIGGIHYLKKIKSKDFLIGNCDTLFRIDYLKFFETHKKNKNLITLVVSSENHVFPYGSCKLKSNRLISFKEKPSFHFMTNAGLYFAKKEIIKLIPRNKFFNMTDLINKCLKLKKKIGVYKISSEAWTDLGQLSDFKKALKDY